MAKKDPRQAAIDRVLKSLEVLGAAQVEVGAAVVALMKLWQADLQKK